MLDKKWK